MAKKPKRSYSTITVKHRLIRVLVPRWAHAPLSGAGAAINGGRFNRPGQDALYVSFDQITAMVEYQQEFGFRPCTLCAYDADIRLVVDLTDSKTRGQLNVTLADLDCAWKEIAWILHQDPPTWRLADRLINDGISGIKVPSFQNKMGFNLVLWKWADVKTRSLKVIDPMGELPKDQKSWQ